MDNESDDAEDLCGQIETLSISSSVQSGASSSSPLKTRTTNRPIHGSLFQLKLSVLFLIKGVTAKYKFNLGTEVADQGGKFDDILFKYEVSTGGQCRWRFLQAKHKQNEDKKKITSDAILDENNGDFSISKYFRSYCQDIINGSEGRRPEEIDDVVICTNINFNEANLNVYGIELVPHNNLTDKILSFEKLPSGKTPLRYKLKNTGAVRKILFECSKNIKLHSLAEKLVDCESKKLPLSLNDELIKNCHSALIKERIIDLKTKRLHSDFIYGHDLSIDASELRRILRDFTYKKFIWKEDWKNYVFKLDDGFGQGEVNQLLSGSHEEIDSFLEKLVFAVNTPNEMELDAIMKIELGKYYNLLGCDRQFEMFFNTMLDWFTKKDWMTSEEGIRILEDVKNKVDKIRASILLDYQNQIDQIAECNDAATQEMSQKLQPFLTSSNDMKINYITTDWPDFTALKVIAAINSLPDFKCSDSYMVISSKHAQKKEDLQDLRRIFSDGKSHRLLVIVCEDHNPISYDNYTNLVARSEKKILLIVRKGTDVRSKLLINEDVINYGQLSEKSQNVILSKKISFQGRDTPVRDLIQPGKAENVLNCSSIKMLLAGKNKIAIPSFNTARFERSFYVKRRMALPFEFDQKFWDNLAEEMKCPKTLLMSQCKINQKGAIVWSANEERKSEIWDRIQIKLRDRSILGLSADVSISENELIFDQKKQSRVVIISGGAGAGKSTVLSHYYEEIKKSNPTHWISRINLVDHCQVLLKFESNTVDSSIDFFVNELAIVDPNNSLGRSLLKHQLTIGDKVIVMFDGFDEISSQLQEKAIQLMKAIIAKKSAQLFVTTRPHMIDQLQFQLSQLAYSLENFSEQNQIDYLSEYWETNLKEVTIEDKSAIIRKFAEYFIRRVTNILKDKEKSFIGIPLQCRLMAECFQSDLQEIIQENRNESEIENLLDGQKFDLATMYKRLMDTKRRVFLEEKIIIEAPNPLVSYAIDGLIKKIEFHLTKMAIKTIFTYQDTVDLLCPPASHHQSKFEKAAEEKTMTEYGLKFGLTFHSGDKIQFVHRTLAEYLVAQYFFQGFILDEEKHNGLLNNQRIRDLIFDVIMMKNNGAYDGVQMFFDSFLSELVDDDEKWRNIIDNRRKNKFPERFTSFMSGILNAQPTVFVVNPKILEVSIYQRNTNIFKFVCDCLEIMIDPASLRKSMSSLFCVSCKFFYEQSSDTYKKFLNYFNHPSESEMNIILHHILYYPMQIYLDDLFWNEEEKKSILRLVLDFMDKNLVTLKRIFKRPNADRDKQVKFALHFFICNDYYDQELKRYIELLSSVCSSETFLNLFRATFNITESHYEKFHLNGKTEKTVILLRNLERNKVLEELSLQILLRDSQVFQRYYQPSLPQDDVEIVSTNIYLLLVRDQYKMTRLDRAAFRGHTEDVVRILETISHSLSPAETNDKVKKTAKKVLHDMIVTRDIKHFAPFFVAAAFGHEEICCKLLIFFKQLVADKMLSVKQLQDFFNGPNGMIYNAIHLAVRFLKLPMFRVILTSVKKVMGQRPLVCLLKEFINNKREWFKMLAEIVIDGTEGTAGYLDLSEIVFHDSDTIEGISVIEEDTLNKMMSAMGGPLWIEKLLKIDTGRGIQVLTRNHFDHFDRNQMIDFLKVFTKVTEGPIWNSMWYGILNLNVETENVFRYPDFETDFDKILQCASTKLTREELRDQLFDVSAHFQVIVRSIILSLLDYGEKSLVNRLLDNLKAIEQDEAIECIMSAMSRVIIPEMLGRTLKDRHSRKNITHARMKVLDFILDHPEYCYDNLADIANAMLREFRDSDGVMRNLWSYVVHLDTIYSGHEMGCKLLKLTQYLCNSSNIEFEENLNLARRLLTQVMDNRARGGPASSG